MQKSKICLTTFIYGVKYQGYIPFLIYSCNKSYPEYDIILFLYDNLDLNIKKQIDLVGKKNLIVKERCFKDCPKMNPLKARSLRWVLWDDIFISYDYLYVVDIDMFYMREPKPLHQQHIEHMATTSLPYDNLRRCFIRTPFKPTSIAYRLHKAGLQNLYGFLFGSKKDFRLSGLHFVKTKSYFAYLDSRKRKEYREKIYNNSYLRNVLSSNDEAFLYQIIKELGMHPEKVPLQTNTTKMLDFDNCSRKEFRPHHGIHLGFFRQNTINRNKVLDSKTYLYYINEFKEYIIKDEMFNKLLELASEDIKAQFMRFYEYYEMNKN